VSVERPMVILQRSADLVALLAARGAMVPTEIAEYVDTPRSSVYRLGDALRDAAMLEQNPDAHLRLSLRWLRLADAARAGMSEWQGARKVLDDLARATRQTVFLTVPWVNEAICIDWARGEAVHVLLLKPGRALPLYAGAAGRITLAYGRDDPTAYLADAPFEAYTERTLTTADQLREDIALTKTQGYVVSDGDVTDGIGALGAPLFWTTTGGFAGALSIGGLAEEVNRRRHELVDMLRAAASTLSATLP
jgi:IclR family acetate operon transcriptional repressor